MLLVQTPTLSRHMAARMIRIFKIPIAVTLFMAPTMNDNMIVTSFAASFSKKSGCFATCNQVSESDHDGEIQCGKNVGGAFFWLMVLTLYIFPGLLVGMSGVQGISTFSVWDDFVFSWPLV
jgi:hypothetical protein